MLLAPSGRRIGRPVFRYIGHLSLSGLCDVVPDRMSNHGRFPSTSLIVFPSASSASCRIPCSLNHAMASVYDIHLNGQSGAVNLDLPKLTITAVVGLARMATGSHICRSLDQQRNMRKIIVIRRLTSMWSIRSSIVVNANSASRCVCSLRWRRVGLFSAQILFCV